jgi:UDP-glucose:(heptosyl)LPS alpha-1,3-glucosyltransferase
VAAADVRLVFLHRALAGGGTEADLRRLATGLAARGHDVHVVVARREAPLAGVTVHRVRVVRAGRLARLLAFAVAAPRAAAALRPDLVVGFGRTLAQDVVRVGGGTHASYLARLEADGLRPPVRGPYHRAILWIERRAFAPGAFRRVLAVSRRAGDEVVRDYRVSPDAVAVLYNGVDLERFHPGKRAGAGAALRAALGIPPGVPLCAAVGTGFRRKGFDLLLALWRHGPPRDARLLLVGGDERLGHWRRAAAALGGRVVVTGPRDDVDAVLAAADVVCVPSRQEAFGNVVLEACAAGTPVVTSRRAGAAELLDGPLAALVVDDPTHLDTLGAALARALGAREALGAAARTLAERWTWAAHVDRVDALLRDTAASLDSRRGRP